MKGWVYVITNKAMPGVVKIGFSLKDPELRASELNHTGAPHPYEVAYEALVEDPRDIEQRTHKALSDRSEGKEWFRLTVEEAVVAIQRNAGQKILAESYKSADRAKAESKRKEQEKVDESDRAMRSHRERLDREYREKIDEVKTRFSQRLQAKTDISSFWVHYWVVWVVVFIFFSFFEKTKYNFGSIAAMSLIALAITPFWRDHLRSRKLESKEYKQLIEEMNREIRELPRPKSEQ